MALNKQYCVYGIDTSCFYFDKEIEMERDLYKFRAIKRAYKESLGKTEDKFLAMMIEEKIKYWNKRINGKKNCLIDMLNINSKKVRNLIPEKLTDKRRISLFDSTLTRCLELTPLNCNVKLTKENTVVNEEIMIISVFYFEVIESLIKNGYNYNGYHYVYLASSAGQIRTKRAVFVREDLLDKHWLSLTCGLTIDKINNKGGMNLNKFNAYLALCNSATDPWNDFDIDRCIVVDDFETNVITEVDYINDVDYSITRQTMPVLIPHTDGAGMISTELSSKNFMMRLPWFKGLLSPFDFKNFVLEHEKKPDNPASRIVKDIWGKEWDIIKDNIQIIFTKSQFKMHAYYDSWQHYKDNFKKYHCCAGKCNVEEDHFKRANINYQMVSSFIDYTDDELKKMCKDSVDFINGICSDKEKQLEMFGISDKKDPLKYNGFQKCLNEYNGLIRDSYCREQLRDLRNKMIKDLYSAKFKVNGYYTFLLPDLYAFCEWLFQDIKIPNGLLSKREVHCKLHKFGQEVDCLRSPHLYQEHSIQNNVNNPEIEKWFITNGCYTSTHDTISKELMFDVDGDTTLIVQDENIINVAKRNQNGIVPLYYNMHKAEKEAVTPESRYKGLSVAFTGGNIGVISNNISKIKNSSEILTPENHDEAMNCLKWNCLINNETIDLAKTLYKSNPPKKVTDILKKYSNRKLPHFFIYAKDKTEDQVEPLTDCIVDKIFKLYPRNRFKMTFTDKRRFDYKILMNDPDITIDADVLNMYSSTVSDIKLKHNSDNKNNNIIVNDIICRMSSFDYTYIEICDMLIKDMFKEHTVFKNDRRKEFLFQTYGDIIYDNIVKNKVKYGYVCRDCGIAIEKKNKNQCRCKKCQEIYRKRYNAQKQKAYYSSIKKFCTNKTA